MGLGVSADTQQSHLAGQFSRDRNTNYDNLHLQDFAVILFIIGCYQVCMIMSALFHTFSSHSQNAHELCLMMDLSGIMASITASFLCGKCKKRKFKDFCMKLILQVFTMHSGATHPGALSICQQLWDSLFVEQFSGTR